MNLFSKFLYSTENDYIDFKREWYSGENRNFNMIHDIICLANSLTNEKDRYIVIGIKEDSTTKQKCYLDVSNDPNVLKAEDIVAILQNHMTLVPQITVIREKTEKNTFFDVIVITPRSKDLPYYLFDSIKKKNSNSCLLEYNIYSRDSGKNTDKPKQCSIYKIEELFARKKGENLSAIERFSLYLDDIDNWKRPKLYSNDYLSVDNYYYLKNHKFKIVKHNPEEKMCKIKDLNTINRLRFDTALGQDYFDYRNASGGLCDEDFYSWYHMELWADNTLVDAIQIMELFIPRYDEFRIHSGYTTFYVPMPEDVLRLKKYKNIEELRESIDWKICKLMYKHDIEQQYCLCVYPPILEYLDYRFD